MVLASRAEGLANAEALELAGDARGVLLLHGFTGSPFEVRPLAEHLHARYGMSVLAPLLAGHGTSPRELAKTTWRDWEASALAALERLEKRAQRIAVAGLSMGGLVALRLALARPEVARALVLMATPLWLPLHRTLAVRALARMGIVRALPKYTGSDVRDLAMRRLRPAYDRFPIRAIVELLELIDCVRRDLGRIRAPALVLHGRHDHTVPAACARTLARELGSQKVQLTLLAKSYHLLPLDVERDQVAGLVGPFTAEMLHD